MANKKKKPEAAAGPSSSTTTDIDAAYAAGNYSRVRELARTNPSEHAAKVKALTDIDRNQVLVGCLAILVVATAAFLTLH